MFDVGVVYIPGYGQSELDEEDDSYPLRILKLDVHSEEFCMDKHNFGGSGPTYERRLRRTFPNYPTEMFMNNQFCAGANPRDGIMGTCPGDSGAPAYWFQGYI